MDPGDRTHVTAFSGKLLHQSRHLAGHECCLVECVTFTKKTSTSRFSPGCFRIEMFQAMKRCLHMCTSDQHCILPDTSCPHLGQLAVCLAPTLSTPQPLLYIVSVSARREPVSHIHSRTYTSLVSYRCCALDI